MTCCRACRSAYGTCLTKNQCRCHRIAYKDDHKPPQYRDPTGEQAVNNVLRNRRKTRKDRM